MRGLRGSVGIANPAKSASAVSRLGFLLRHSCGVSALERFSSFSAIALRTLVRFPLCSLLYLRVLHLGMCAVSRSAAVKVLVIVYLLIGIVPMLPPLHVRRAFDLEFCPCAITDFRSCLLSLFDYD